MKKNYFYAMVIQFSLMTLFSLIACTVATAQNYVTTYAGNGASALVNGDTANCSFKTPFGICRDKSGNLFVADQENNCVRKITPAGIVSTYAGTGIAGYNDGVASSAQFNNPIDVCADDSGNIYVSDFMNQYIRKISVVGVVSTVAGNGIAGYVDGAAASAEFNYPRGICIDPQGNLYVGDSWNHRIRKISSGGEVSTYAGGGNVFGVQSVSEFKDGNDTSARFYTPCGLSIDDAGNVYVADAYNHRVRKIDSSRVVTTLAGGGASGSSAGGFADGDTSIARFNTLTELFVTQSGEIFVGDTYNHRIRLVSSGNVSTVAGSGAAGFLDGVDTIAEFNRPRGVVADSSGKYLWIGDNLNRRIRKITFNLSVGMEDLNKKDEFLAFPNPFSDKLYISGNISGKEIRVTDFLGRKIFSGICHEDDAIEINLETLPQGMYLVSLFSENTNLRTCKVIKAD